MSIAGATKFLIGGAILALLLGIMPQSTPTASALATVQQTLVSGGGGGPAGSLDPAVTYYDGVAWVPAYIVAAHPAYTPPILGTQYINSGPTYNVLLPNPTIFKTTFVLPATFLNAALSIDLHADNYAEVFVNGVSIGSQLAAADPANFQGPPTTFATTSTTPFVSGVNVLTVVLTNFTLGFDPVDNPKAVDFKAVVSYTPPWTGAVRSMGYYKNHRALAPVLSGTPTTTAIFGAIDSYSSTPWTKFLAQYGVTLFNLSADPSLATAVFNSSGALPAFDSQTVGQLVALGATYTSITPSGQLLALKDAFDAINNGKWIWQP